MKYANTGNSLVLSGERALLTVHKECTPHQRENYVNEWYRDHLKSEIKKITKMGNNLWYSM